MRIGIGLHLTQPPQVVSDGEAGEFDLILNGQQLELNGQVLTLGS